MHRFVLLGFTTAGMPVYAMRGGAPDDNDGGGDDNENDDTGADDNENDDADIEDEYKPPTKEEFALMQKKLQRANGEAASRRKWLEAAGIDPKSGKKLESDDDEEETPPPRAAAAKAADGKAADVDLSQYVPATEFAKLDKARRTEGKRAAQREAALTKRYVESAAKAALAEAGWNGQGADIVHRFIDLGEVEIDDTGEIGGLEEQILELKGSMPDWFKKKRAATGTRRANGAGAGAVDASDKSNGTRAAEPPKTWLEKLSAQMDEVE